MNIRGTLSAPIRFYHAYFYTHNWPLFLKAVRPWSLAMSLTPIILGTVLAWKCQQMFDALVLLLTSLTVLCIHSAGNLVNTYYDFKRGIDNKKSDDRTLVDHILTPHQLVELGQVLYSLACFFFLVLTHFSPARIELLALVYFGGMSSSFLYTGGIGFKYMALGDVVIIMTFGPLVVTFAYMVQCGGLSLLPIFYAAPLAMHTEAVLHSNNVRDAASDRSAGIVTLAILLGPTLSYVAFCLLLFVPYLLFLAYSLNWSWAFVLPLVSIFEAFRIEQKYREIKEDDALLPKRMARLATFIGFLYVAAVAITQNNNLPFYRSLREIF